MKMGRRQSNRVTMWLSVALMCILSSHAPAQGSGAADQEALAALSNSRSTESIRSSSSNPAMSSAFFVPVILTASGRNNSLFTSELTLTNRGAEEATLHYTYTSDAGGGSGTATDRLAGGRQRIEPDALSYLRRLGIPIPNSGNRRGTLRAEVAGSLEVGISVRTTTSVPEGRAGLAYPGVATADGFQEAVYLCGLRQNSHDRSNLAFQNMGIDGEITLRTTLYSGEAENQNPHVLSDVILPPGGFHQYNGILNRAGFDNGYVRVERVEGAGPFYAYGVINDQVNSDGSFVFPVTASSLTGTTEQTLPVIVETGIFTSELAVTNFSHVAKTVIFRFRADAVETADRKASFEWTVQPGQQVIVPDIVEQMRQWGTPGIGPSGKTFAGALFATVTEGDMSGIVIGARTSSSDGRGGQYGVSYNGVPAGSAFTESVWVDALQQNAENRSNLALVNIGDVDDNPSVFQLDIYDGTTGMLATTVNSLRVAAKGWRQINGILGKYAPGRTQGYARITKISGTNSFLAYGVINDGGAPGQRSGDGAYLRANLAMDDPVTEPMTDLEVLEILYRATGGPNWTNSTNWLSAAPLSEWFGVSTDESGRVKSLSLRRNGLGGTIPSALGQLAHLEMLDLLYNELSGAIPRELGSLASLQWLSFGHNDLSGEIPPGLARLTRLQQLHLGGNDLSGEIPPELGRLTQLQSLNLGHNDLSGEIPRELAALTRLQRLDLGVNELSGAIPPELGSLTSLQWLFLGNNPLIGAIPVELAKLTQLQTLNLPATKLRGIIPPQLGKLSRLQLLNLFDNELSGTMPTTFRQLSELMTLDIRDTNVCVPKDATFLAWLDTLSSFHSSGLACDGTRRINFSASSYELKEGETVAVSVRLIDQTGEPLQSTEIGLTVRLGDGATAADYSGVPERITIMAPANEAEFFFTAVADETLDDSETVSLGFRQPLPDGITAGSPDTATVTIYDSGTEREPDREALEALYRATGGPKWTSRTNWRSHKPLSEWYGVAADESGHVTSLSLSRNGLSGSIPPELGQLSQLRALDLGNNELSGAILRELGGLTHLQELDLKFNELSGTIPLELADLTNLQLLDLESNRLTGTIPSELGALTQLQTLSLRSNQLTGLMPTELGGLIQLQRLDVGINELSGTIPPELGQLSRLQRLSLQFNQLSGTIPPELGSLSQLLWLHLSANQLNGMIPPELTQLVTLRHLRLGFNSQLTGTIPVGLERLHLTTLDLMSTSVCVPEDAQLQQWLATIDFASSGLTCGRPASAVSTIDLLVVYTTAARREAGGTAQMEAKIDLLIAETNQAYVDSGANQRLVLVAREEVNYTETRNPGEDFSRLRDASDGYMDEVHTIRDRAGADLVHLIAQSGNVGEVPGAFSTSCDWCGSRSFAHEIGHNMGLHHDRYVDRGRGLFPYSHGYVNQQALVPGARESAGWRTIMAYPSQCSKLSFSCDEIMRFSNPNQTYLGDALGITGSERTTAVNGPADAVRTLDLTRHSVAGFRLRAPGSRLTTLTTVSNVRPITRTNWAAVPAPGGNLFRTVEPNVRGSALRQASAALDRATLRRRETNVDVGMLARVREGGSTVLRLNLFDDVVLMGIIEQWTPTYSGGYALLGRVAGVTEGTVTLVVNGSVVAGTVRIRGATYRIRPAGAGRQTIMQVDPSQLPYGCQTVSRTPSFKR